MIITVLCSRRGRLLLVLLTCLLVNCLSFAAGSPPEDEVATLQHGWATACYQTPDAQKEAQFQTLAAAAQAAVARNPGRAEPMIWQAIILSSYAKFQGGLGALDKINRARDELLAAEKIDPKALDGSVYTSLGSLYAKAPGWPLAFGDKQQAKIYLEKALAINPNGIDPNYFYGEMLADQKQTAEARRYLEKALAAPARPGRADADIGRRAEIQSALSKLNAG